MSDTDAQEPTMEEILASIRRIISEDEPPAPSTEAGSASPPHGDVHEDILELTERVDESPSASADDQDLDEPADFESSGDLDIYTRSAAPAEPEPTYQSSFADEDDALVSAPTAQTASSSFGQLARSVSMPAEGRSLEDVTRELLRPLLKDWLDRNLPSIVETAVQAEVERIARQQRR
jgi:cell pole-organizing protein PopZ